MTIKKDEIRKKLFSTGSTTIFRGYLHDCNYLGISLGIENRYYLKEITHIQKNKEDAGKSHSGKKFGR